MKETDRMYDYLVYNTISWTAMLAGLVQTLLYGDFFYNYIASINKQKMVLKLPV